MYIKVNANTKSVSMFQNMMNTMSARDDSKEVNISALKQTVNGLVAAAADRQNPCNKKTPSNQTVNPEDCKNGEK